MSVNFDSHGSSALGERLESVLRAFRKSVTPSQVHLGTADANRPLNVTATTIDLAHHVFSIGQSVYVLISSLATIDVEGEPTFAPWEGYIKLSADLATVQDVRLEGFTGGSTRFRDAVESGGVIYLQAHDTDFGAQEIAIYTATQEVAFHNFFDHTGIPGRITDVFIFGTSVVHSMDVLDGVNNDAGFLVANSNGTITATHRYAHTPDFFAPRCASDGASYYMFGRFGSSVTEVVVAKILASDFSVVQVVKYTLPSGAGTLQPLTDGPCIVSGGTVFIHITRTGSNEQPVWLGIDTEDLTNVLWSKSAKKQTAEISIGINDSATTYKITIGVQVESVTGNGGGAAATATDLRNACAASAQTNFLARTWTVDGAIVTGAANHAGITWTTLVSVTGGTGTISAVDAKNIHPIVFHGSASAGSDIVLVGHGAGGKYGIAKIRSGDGVVLAAALSNEASEAPVAFQSVTAVGADFYACGSSGRAGNRFGSAGDTDLEIIPFSEIPSNNSLLTDDVSWTVTTESLSLTTVTSGFPAISDARTPLQVPSEVFQSAASDYTF